MHVIVGQGQLDSVLHAEPEDRRGFIEEAAGVLKHRKRKEKALRKLDAMQANLTRLTDLTDELRRQLKPLGRQAEVARRAAVVQADLRDARLRLLADDLVGAARPRWPARSPTRAPYGSARALVERDLRRRPGPRGRAGGGRSPPTRRRWPGPRRPGTAVRAGGAGARHRPAGRRARRGTCPRTRTRPGPAGTRRSMEREAAEVRDQEEELRAALDDDRGRLAEAVAERQELEQRLAAAERALVAAARAVADRREGLARLGGQVDAVRTRLGATAGGDRPARRGRRPRPGSGRRPRRRSSTTLQAEVGALDEGELGLDERHETAVAAYGAAEAQLRELGEARAAGGARPGHLVGPPGRAGARADPQGRRRRAARRRRPGCPACSARWPRC